MKLKMKLPAFVLSLSIAAMSFLMAAPQKVSALDNEGVSVSDSVTEKAQEVSDVNKESNPDKEKPYKIIDEKEFMSLFLKARQKLQKDNAKSDLAVHVIFTVISALCGSHVCVLFFGIHSLLDLLILA